MIYYIDNNDSLVNSNLYLKATLDDLIQFLESTSIIGVDTETEGMFDFSNRVIMLQIGNKDNQYVIDTRNVDVSRLQPYMESDKWLKIFHNAKFDLNFLRFSFGWNVRNIYDTFLAQCLLTAGFMVRGLSLETLVLKYCDYQLNKEVRNKFVGLQGVSFTDLQIKYGAEDVVYLETIKDKQLLELASWDLGKVMDLENRAVRVFADIEYNGMRLDVSKWLEIAKKTYIGTQEYEKKLNELVLNDNRLKEYQAYQIDLFSNEPKLSINWGSSTQVLPILKKIGLDVESTSERDILKFKNRHPIVFNLLAYKKQRKLNDAFGENFLSFINPITQRIHPSFWQVLSTGRVSCSEPNLLQIPSKGELGKEIRSAFIAREGYSIVGGDYSGMELRIIAEFSQDPLWVNAFKEGKDLHSELAALTFDIPLSEVKSPLPVKPDITYRDVQKIINFGLIASPLN